MLVENHSTDIFSFNITLKYHSEYFLTELNKLFLIKY
jgi:hypothetical protein